MKMFVYQIDKLYYPYLNKGNHHYVNFKPSIVTPPWPQESWPLKRRYVYRVLSQKISSYDFSALTKMDIYEEACKFI